MKREIDPAVFFTAFVILLAASLPIFFWPTQAGPKIIATYDWIAENLGLLYQFSVIGAAVFLSWIAFGKHGKIRLGGDSEAPEFSTFSWMSMLFCGGVGAGLIYWATIEWGYYLDKPPFGVAAGTEEGRLLATSYGLFHWGPFAWIIYALPTVAISYQFYVRKAPNLRLSTACHGLIKQPVPAAIFARVLDGLFMLSLLAGAGTSIGLAVPMISASLCDTFGIVRNLSIDIGVVLCSVSLIAISAFLGLSKGMSKLANFNVWMVFIFLLFILITGPTQFILRVGLESIGYMLSNIVRMVTYTDAIKRTGFVESWTIFYWAWWIAYGPFVGIFVTRISKGRTLKELILSMAVFGSLGAWIFYVILGNYSYWLDLNGILSVRTLIKTSGSGQAVSAVMGTLPAGQVMRFIFAVISIIFIAGTYNSKAYALAASSTKDLSVGDDPSRWNRVFWALVLGMLPIALMSIDGGIKIAMSAVLIASLPLLFISFLMSINMVKSLKTHGEIDTHPELRDN
ncbi:MAG: BCCT family transporter [Cytophaga sp.]|nr:BCCT family transporter [Undibacterium sp.]